MRWTHALVAVAVVAMSASMAAAQTAPPAKLVWEKTPTSDDIKRVYPPDAWQKGIAGGAMIGCDVADSGQLLNCKSFAEEPANMGFGQAGVTLGPQFQLKPGTFAQALPVAGRIAIPMVMTPPGRAFPKLGFKVGDSAMLITGIDLPRDASALTRLGCIGADAGHRCTIHFLSWTGRPNTMTGLGATLRANADHGGDLLLCWVKPDGGLTDCQASSPAARVIADDLAAGFRAPRLTDDRTPVGAGPIMISLSWAPLNAAAQALKPAP